MIVPVERATAAVNRVCAEGAAHRHTLGAAAVAATGIAAVTPRAGFVSAAAVGSASLAASWGGVGYVSRWRGWDGGEA